MTLEYTVDDLLMIPTAGQGGEETPTDMTIIADYETLEGFSIMHGVVPAKGLLAPHVHHVENQAIYVIDGSLEMEIGGEDGLRFSAPAGSYVIKPKGISHSFWNLSDTDVNYIELTNGPDFQGMIRDRSNPVKAALHTGDFGVKTFPPRIPKLLKENRLKRLASVHFGGRDGK